MKFPKADDPFGSELRRLADNLGRDRIRAVGAPIGLGKVNTLAPRAPEYQETAHLDFEPGMSEVSMDDDLFLYSNLKSPVLQQPTQTDAFSGAFSAAPMAPANAMQPQVGTRAKRGFGRFLIAHGIDLVVVCGTLIGALIFVGMIVAPHPLVGKVSTLTRVSQWLPVRMILGMGILEFIVLLYIIFAGYWVLFRLVCGATLGRFFVGNRASTHEFLDA